MTRAPIKSLRGAESSSNVARTFFNTAHLLPKALRFEHQGAKLVFLPRAPSDPCTLLGAGCASALPKVLIFRNLGRISKNLDKEVSTLFTIIWKLYFLVVECRNESLLCDRKHTDIFKINKLFLVTSCFVCDSR